MPYPLICKNKKSMFLKAPGKPNGLKKAFYLLSSTILGVFLSFIAHALIEINYLRQAISQNEVITFYGGCTLWPSFRIGLLVLSAVGGFWLGRFWWRKVYIERAWAKKRSAE